MEFLKELFTEPLSFEAFQKAVTSKGYKLADLSTGKYADLDKLKKATDDLGVKQHQTILYSIRQPFTCVKIRIVCLRLTKSTFSKFIQKRYLL